MGNMIFDDDMNVVAVLDWEMAWLGSPEIDLGWWVFFDRYYTEGIGAPFCRSSRTVRRRWPATPS